MHVKDSLTSRVEAAGRRPVAASGSRGKNKGVGSSVESTRISQRGTHIVDQRVH